MSGPKVSLYRLEPYVRENILRQRRLKVRCLSLYRRIGGMIEGLAALEESCAEKLRESANVLAYGKESGAAELSSAVSGISERKAALTAALAAAGPAGPVPVKYRYSPEAVEEDEKKVRLLLSLKRECESALDASRKAAADLEDRLRAAREAVSGEAAAGAAALMGFDFNAIAVRREKQDWSRRDRTAGKLRELLADPAVSDGLKAKARTALGILNSAESARAADGFAAVMAAGILRDAERERAERAEEAGEFEERIREYHALCEACGEEPRPFVLSAGWREALGAASAELEARLDREISGEYVAEALDSVMAEMGYQVLGRRDVRKKSGKSFRSSLYSFADGRGVSVTRTDGGQITMEICGLDHGDRLPESREAKALEEDMYSFCAVFPEIERRLKEKGVLAESRISMAPPSEEYASIINLDDFILTADHVGTISVGTESGAGGAKEMRAE